MKLPEIEILFKKLASTAVARSERGVAAVILRDDTSEAGIRKYTKEAELLADKSKYTEDSYRYIQDALYFSPAEVYAVSIGAEDELDGAFAIIEGSIKSGWVTLVGTAEEYAALAKWCSEQNIKGRTYKAVVYNHKANDKHIVNFANAQVTFKDERGISTGDKYLPSLAGILACCNIMRGCTGFVCQNLNAVQEVADYAQALSNGEFILLNDFNEVRVGLGINSLTDLALAEFDDMKYIDNVETMDLIKDDVSSAFKATYQGKYKNTYDNQIMLMSAINTYLQTLAAMNVLDAEYDNHTEVDIAKQREAWEKVKPEAAQWSDAEVRKTAYRGNVYLDGVIKIAGSMESIRLELHVF